jgi:asparagine synthase (glutamine-hydrolysing)
MKEVLNDPAAQKRGLFRKKTINEYLENPEKHITSLRGSKLWQVALLEYWLQTHEINT